ncbi:MAG TPA: DmsE family decaheme c-type cytochrome, partial [Gammaproteobacteria bacterium]
SVHQREGLACVSCHTIHAAKDPLFVKTEQPGVCYKCHQPVRADFAKFSRHPVRDGNMDCTSCHAPHDSLNRGLLIASTVNDTCYTCHAEKRGPFLWEHPPAAEDCSLCHTPHGSVNPSLLVNRPPMLCQSCHSPAGHPSLAFTAGGLPGGGGAPNSMLVAGSCLNCHSQVHGSNDPSGSELNR